MSKVAFFVGLALLIAACVHIPKEPLAASLPPQAAVQRADCPGDYLDMLPGQSASDPMLSSLPGYIDIVGMDASIEGDNLTAIFFLKEISEELAFNREGVEDINLEYVWTVSINIEGHSLAAFDQTDHSLAAFMPQEGNRHTRRPWSAHSKTRWRLWFGITSTCPIGAKRSC